MDKGNCIADKMELQNLVKLVSAREQFGPSRTMQDGFVLVVGNGEEGSML